MFFILLQSKKPLKLCECMEKKEEVIVYRGVGAMQTPG